MIGADEFHALRRHRAALALLLGLRLAHVPGAPFRLPQRAAGAFAMSPNTAAAALEVLVAKGFVQVLKAGSSRRAPVVLLVHKNCASPIDTNSSVRETIDP